MKVYELRQLIDCMKADDEVLLGEFNAFRGEVTYSEPSMDAVSISRDKEGEPIECLDGEGGNEFALVIQ